MAERRKRLSVSLFFLIYLSYPLLCPVLSFQISNIVSYHPLQHRSIAVLPLLFCTSLCIYSFEHTHTHTHTHTSSTPNNHAVSLVHLISPIPPFEISRWLIPQLNCGPYCSSPSSFPSLPSLRTHLTPFTVDLLLCCQSPATTTHIITLFFIFCLGLLYQSSHSLCSFCVTFCIFSILGLSQQPSRPGHIICLLLPLLADSFPYLSSRLYTSTYDIEIP